MGRCAGRELLREVPRHHEPREHRQDEAPDYGHKPLRARQLGPLKQRVQHAAILGAGRAKHKAGCGAVVGQLGVVRSLYGHLSQ